MRVAERLLLCLLIAPGLSRALRTVISETECGEAQVYIAVSPLKSSKESRVLEIYWFYPDSQVGDQIALYDYDPVLRRPNELGLGEPVRTPSRYPQLYRHPRSQSQSQGGGGPQDAPDPRSPLVIVSTDGLSRGFRATHIMERHVPADQLGYQPRCLNYWATYERRLPGAGANDTEVLAVSCLRTRPTWMWTFRDMIGGLSLHSLFIPGTHDSAAYREDGSSKLLDRYSVTQDETVLAQLIHGIRYIDLRVGFYPKKDVQWWANHGPIRMQPLLTVLHDIKAFIDNTNEIVILDVQEFPSGFGSDNTVHLKLVHLLDAEVGELMATRDGDLGWSSSLRDVWSRGRRLIVGYDKEDVLPASRKLWPSVRQFWPDAQTPQQLSDYMHALMRRPPFGFPWALMAELTLNARHIATHPTASLRRHAHLVNRNVTFWARSNWEPSFNVLAVDFFRYTGVVEAAVISNLRRSPVVEYCAAFRLMNSE